MTSTALDRIDRKIIHELQLDGRQSHQELSERIGLSPSPIARRIKKLESDGYITGYGARVDEAKMGFGFSVFVFVKLDKQVDDRLMTFESEILGYPEVMDCWLMTGSFDYLLRVAVHGLPEFERFLTGRLTKVIGVASIESSIPLRRVKDQTARI